MSNIEMIKTDWHLVATAVIGHARAANAYLQTGEIGPARGELNSIEHIFGLINKPRYAINSDPQPGEVSRE